ncbi:hypothetical protein HG530_004847 [Fusarium avenaceum]|nr:hypothetical protein HG530_004847 [Fusarium avenaceum]
MFVANHSQKPSKTPNIHGYLEIIYQNPNPKLQTPDKAACYRQEVFLFLKIGKVRICVNKLGNFIRINIIRIRSLVVTGNISKRLAAGLGLVSEDACPFTMWEFASLDFTSPCIAKVRTLKNVAFSTVCPLLAIPVEAKASAHWGCWGGLGVSIRTVSLGAVALGKMQAVGGAFRSHVMGEIARLAVDALPIFQNVFTERNLVWIVDESAPWAFGA